MEASHRADDDSIGVDGGGASAGRDDWFCVGGGLDDVSGRAAAELRDGDHVLVCSRRARDPVWVLCVSTGAVQLRVYGRRRTVLVRARWSPPLLPEYCERSDCGGDTGCLAALRHGAA